MRVRAHEREAAWAPRYVANELAGTHQAATRAQQDAAAPPRRGRRRHSPGPTRAGSTARPQQTAALAGTLEARAAELSELDDARSRWLAHTAGTRAAAERAKAELAARHADDAEPEQRTSPRPSGSPRTEQRSQTTRPTARSPTTTSRTARTTFTSTNTRTWNAP